MKINIENIEIEFMKKHARSKPDLNFSNSGELSSPLSNLCFFDLLAQKINKAPTLEKLLAFYTLAASVLNDEIDLSYKNKERFLFHFLFDKLGGEAKHKTFDYLSPISLSLYCPEFFETINESISEGENLPLPCVALTETNPNTLFNADPQYASFIEMLNKVENELSGNVDENFATLLLTKWLKEAAYCSHADFTQFLSIFRKTDVLKNDPVTLMIYNEERNCCTTFVAHKDVMVWNMLNSNGKFKNTKVERLIRIDPMLYEKLNEFFQCGDKDLLLS